jgi:hypothetical protein
MSESGLIRRIGDAALIGVAYLGVAAFTTFPAIIRLGEEVPGAARSDLYNSLWSIWLFLRMISGGAGVTSTDVLDFPHGGSIMVADPVGALIAAPLVWLAGLPVAYTVLVLAQLALAGWAAHHFGADLASSTGKTERALTAPAGWVAGVAYAAAPVVLSGVHNGTSEAFGAGWPALAAWACWRTARDGGLRSALVAGVLLLIAAASSWYGAVCAFLFAGAFSLLGSVGGLRARLGARLGALALGLLLVVPLARLTTEVAQLPDSLVGIKHPRELSLVRRTVGPADPIGWFMPGDYRSPDFRVISRYGEQFFHCHYLGWVVLLGAFLGVRRSKVGTAPVVLASVAAAVLAMGPVVARHGQAVIVMADRALPLPYLLIEELPGFSSLSLLYKLGMGASLGLAVLAGRGLGRSGRGAALAVALILFELRVVSPMAGWMETSSSVVSPAIEALAAEPEGAVMNFPVAGGRDYLFEQTVHGKPLCASLNFPNNSASKKVWQAMLGAADLPPAEFRARTTAASRAVGVRYLVDHSDPMARPDMHDTAVKALRRSFEPIASGPSDGAEPAGDTRVRVYRLW